MKSYTKPFSQLGKNDAALAGGKGASLGELTNAGIPVPSGFVVVSAAFEQFLTTTKLQTQIDAILSRVDTNEMKTVDSASEKIKTLILREKMPADIEQEIVSAFKKLGAPFVAVRSSATAEDGATHAWAGQLESYLNTTADSLLENVKRCWASLFTSRAIFYRFEKKLDSTKISVAVVVQQMIQSEVSGIAFSVHPVTQDYNQMIIEAGFGLGEAIVSGQITPDSYVVDKRSSAITEKNVFSQERGLFKSSKSNNDNNQNSNDNEWKTIPAALREKQKLSDLQIFALSTLIIQIEKHYGFPCDIEWAFADGKFFVVQSRPITTLDGAQKTAPLKLTKFMSREQSLAYFYIWQQGNQPLTRGWYRPVKHILFVNDGVDKKTKVYYNDAELNDIYNELGIFTAKDKNYFPRLSKEFTRLTKELIAYVDGKRHITSLADLKQCYDLCVEWYAPMAMIYSLPESETAPKQIRDAALKLRSWSEKYAGVADKIFSDFIRRAYPQFAHLIRVFTPDEMLRMDTLSKADLAKVASRDEGYAFYNGILFSRDGLANVLTTNKLLLDDPTAAKSSENENDLHGACASRGQARGKVIIIRGKKDLAKVGRDSILVTEMTSPDYVPYMKIAAAIVTDEGGVNCHAAIVSREIGIPCVIGTKVATQVLRDGDLVEVDATAGVVRKVSEQSHAAPKINLSDYELVFRIRGVSLLVADFVILQYPGKVVLTQRDDQFRQFFHKKIVHAANDEGMSIYGSDKNFKVLQNKLVAVRKRCDLLFKNVNKQWSPDAVAQALDAAAWASRVYSYTNLEYTDAAFVASATNNVIAKNLTKLIKIKDPYRSFINDLFFAPDKYVGMLLQKISETFLVSTWDLHYYLSKEIAQLFEGTRVDTTEIARRKEAYTLTRTTDGIVLFSGQQAVADTIIEPPVNNVGSFQSNRISGTVANAPAQKPKIVSGIVTKIDVDYSRFDAMKAAMTAMKKGTILVAQTTAPELMIACKKASAIITDNGGLLSHAAIVSRELGIPCIVGTGNASELLSTGDVVEIDATTGVVCKLENNNNNSNNNNAVEPASRPTPLPPILFDESKWIEQGKWVQPPLVYTLFSHYHTSNVAKAILPEIQFHTVFSIDGHAFQFAADSKNIDEQLKMLAAAKKLHSLVESLDENGEKLCSQLTSQLSKGDAYVQSHAAKIFALYKELTSFWMLEAYIGDRVSIVAKSIGFVDTEAALFAKVHPHLRRTWLEEESKVVLDIAIRFVEKYGSSFVKKKLQTDKALSAATKAYIDAYSWCRISKWMGELIDEDYALHRIAEEVENIRLKNHVPVARSSLPEKKLDGIVLLSVCTAYWRSQCGKMEMLMAQRMRAVLERLAAENKMSYEQVLLLSPQEFVIALTTRQISNKDEVLAREESYFSFVDDSGAEIVLSHKNDAYRRVKEIYVNDVAGNSASQSNILTGVGASPGRVEGRVRIIQSAKEFKLFKKGEVLVAPETTPLFVPLMRMACAILTGKGGITSHAAIVSRELGKPCIIAIKDVTKLLKTGDLVEIDATNGTVRRI